MDFTSLIGRFHKPAPVVAVLRLSGVIGQAGAMKKGLNMASLAGPIERAFKMRNLEAVALAVNSPGGSPVQSALIAKRIRALSIEKEIPVIAFAEDVAASGGYWLACAADEIFADENSIIGSIGVVSGGFGVPELMKRMGVERRLRTAGDRKAMLDPFSREKAEDGEHLQGILAEMHENFKEMVRTCRAGKLNVKIEDPFSGAFWTGNKALEMGLIDGIGDLRGILRERFGEKVKLRVVSIEKSGWLRRKLGLSANTWADELIGAIEERVTWSRFGL